MNTADPIRSSLVPQERITSSSRTVTGWLLDVYPNEANLTLWVIGLDGRRYRFYQDFGATVYAAGPSPRLRALWKWLSAQPIPVHLERTERLDVFHGKTTILAATVLQPVKLDELFHSMVEAFPELTYYDADISVPLRHAAAFGVFPLARCRFELRGKKVIGLAPINTPWELDPEAVPLRILRLEPDSVPGLTGLGALLAGQGDLEGAETVLRRALGHDAEAIQARFNLAQVLERAKRASEAAAEYRRVAGDEKASPDLRAAARARLPPQAR